MKDYTVTRAFWRSGILQKVGDVIHLAEKEAKYLAHALGEAVSKVEAEVETKVEAVVKRVRPSKPARAVVEAPADGDHPVN